MGKLTEKENYDIIEEIRRSDLSRGSALKKVRDVLNKYTVFKNDKPYVCAQCWEETREPLKIIVIDIENYRDRGITKKALRGVCEKCSENQVLWDKVK